MRAHEHLEAAEGCLAAVVRDEADSDPGDAFEPLLLALTHSIVALAKAQIRANTLADEHLEYLSRQEAVPGA